MSGCQFSCHDLVKAIAFSVRITHWSKPLQWSHHTLIKAIAVVASHIDQSHCSGRITHWSKPLQWSHHRFICDLVKAIICSVHRQRFICDSFAPGPSQWLSPLGSKVRISTLFCYLVYILWMPSCRVKHVFSRVTAVQKRIWPNQTRGVLVHGPFDISRRAGHEQPQVPCNCKYPAIGWYGHLPQCSLFHCSSCFTKHTSIQRRSLLLRLQAPAEPLFIITFQHESYDQAADTTGTSASFRDSLI